MMADFVAGGRFLSNFGAWLTGAIFLALSVSPMAVGEAAADQTDQTTPNKCMKDLADIFSFLNDPELSRPPSFEGDYDSEDYSEEQICVLEFTGSFGGIVNTGQSDLAFANQFFDLSNNRDYSFKFAMDLNIALSEATKLILRGEYSHYALSSQRVVNRPTGISGPAVGDITVGFIGAGLGLKTRIGPGDLGGVVLVGNAHTEVRLPGFRREDDEAAFEIEIFFSVPVMANISIRPSVTLLKAFDGTGNPGTPDVAATMLGATITF